MHGFITSAAPSLPTRQYRENLTNLLLFQTLIPKPDKGWLKALCCITLLLAASGVITAKSFQLDYKLDEVTESVGLHTHTRRNKKENLQFDVG